MTTMPMVEKKLTLLIIIPEQHLRENIAASLKELYEVHIATTLDEVLESPSVFKAEIVLCHQSLIQDEQANKLAEIKECFEGTRILVVGPSRPLETQITALKHGARGYFDESLNIGQLEEALKIIYHGEVWVERHVISGLIDELTEVPTIAPAQQQALDTLSPKEMEVAERVSYGATNKMIARSMNITERTVKAHLTTIFQKMSIQDRLSLAIFFRDLR